MLALCYEIVNSANSKRSKINCSEYNSYNADKINLRYKP